MSLRSPCYFSKIKKNRNDTFIMIINNSLAFILRFIYHHWVITSKGTGYLKKWYFSGKKIEKGMKNAN